MKCHCLLLHIHLHEWNLLRIKYFYIFFCITGTLPFAPLVWAIVRSIGEVLTGLETRETSVSLPSLPARATTYVWFPRAPYQQLLLQFHLAVNSVLLLGKPSPGSGGCSEEMHTCLCPVPSWPLGTLMLAPQMLLEQRPGGSCQHSCPLFPGDPLLLGLLSECPANTVNRDPIFP